MKQTLWILALLSFALQASAGGLYMSATIGGEERLLHLDDDGVLSDVTVEPLRARDLAVSQDGRVLAALWRDGGIVSWDVTSGESRLVSAELSFPTSLAVGIGDELIVTDGWRGLFRIDVDGDARALFSDPTPDLHLIRYQGAALPSAGPAAGDALFLRRSFRCFAEEPTLHRVSISDASDTSFVVLPHEALDMTLIDDDQRVLAPVHGCAGSDLVMRTSLSDGETDSLATWPSAQTSAVTAGADGQVYRLADRERVERLAADGESWELVLELAGEPIWAITTDDRPLDHALRCGSPRNHGDYVSCVVHRTKELVRNGQMNSRERADVIRAAAMSDVGKSID